MNKIEKVLSDEIKKMQGFVLGFGNLSEKLINNINKNNNINEFVLLSDEYTSSTGNAKLKGNKKIAYRNIRKKFKNKNVTNIVASYDELGKYHRRFIADSLYLTEQNIYVFIKNEDIDEELVTKRYQRYHQKLEIIECRDGFILHIEKSKYRKNKIRDLFYLIIDCIIDGINFIGDLFVI